MSAEKTIFDALQEIWRGFNRLWLWSIGTGTLAAVLGFVFKEFITGVLGKVGEWFAMKILNKKKVQHIREKAAKADERGQLHKFLAEELYKVNTRLDCCEQRHIERDLKDAETAKKLVACHNRREELEIKSVKLINEMKAAAIENAKLMADNSRLRGRLERG